MPTRQNSGTDVSESGMNAREPANNENSWRLKVGLVLVSPVLALCVFVVVVCLAAIAAKMPYVIHEFAPWVLCAFATFGLVSAMKERVSYKRVAQDWQKRCAVLEQELTEAKHQVLLLEEGFSFHQSLETSANSTHAPSAGSGNQDAGAAKLIQNQSIMQLNQDGAIIKLNQNADPIAATTAPAAQHQTDDKTT